MKELVQAERLAEAQRLDAEVRALVERRRRDAAPIVAQVDGLLKAAQDLDAQIEALGEVGALELARDEGGERLAELFRTLVGAADLLCLYWEDWAEPELAAVNDLADRVERDGFG